MKKRVIVTLSLSLSLSLSLGLGGMHSRALAQQTAAPVILGNVNGSCVTAPPVGNPGANAGDWTITCGDLNPGAGMTVIGPSWVEKGPPPVDLAPAPAPATDSEPAPGDELTPVQEPAAESTVDAVETETAVASDTDLDADNYPDALEVEIGLDPSNPDTDGDGVADGDEVNIYGTDPLLWDTDGDDISDGEEVAAGTDPLDPASAVGTVEDTVSSSEGTASEASSLDSDADRLADGDEAAFGTDPNNPDSDGDGYYDGDEVNLGTDPLAPASFPAE